MIRCYTCRCMIHRFGVTYPNGCVETIYAMLCFPMRLHKCNAMIQRASTQSFPTIRNTRNAFYPSPQAPSRRQGPRRLLIHVNPMSMTSRTSRDQQACPPGSPAPRHPQQGYHVCVRRPTFSNPSSESNVLCILVNSFEHGSGGWAWLGRAPS